MKKPITWLRVLVLGSVLMWVYAAVIAVVNYYIGFAGAVVLGVLLCLFAFPAIGARLININWAIGAAWFGLIIGIALTANNAGEKFLYSITAGMSSAEQVPVQYAFTYDEPVLYFADGIVRGDLASSTYASGTNCPRTGGSCRPWKSETRVAPLIWDGWDEERGVTVWVVCYDTWDREVGVNEITTCTNEWDKPYRAGYAVSATDRFAAEDAIAAAEKEHGIRSHGTPRIIYWSHDPAAEFKTSNAVLWFILVFFELIWIGAMVGRRKDFPITKSP